MATTKHTCNDGNGPAFGRRTAGCPRCDELSAGAKPVKWHGGRAEYERERAQNELVEARLYQMRTLTRLRRA